MEERINELTERIEGYARSLDLKSVLKALPFISRVMRGKARSEAVEKRHMQELLHCLEVCEILMDLDCPISEKEKDILLAAVLLHVYPENFMLSDPEERLVTELGFDPEVAGLADIIVQEKDPADEEQEHFYQRVRENRLALLAVLADRGNIVQQLYRYSTWNAHRYINETKVCYYPLAIYGKEHYHSLLEPISVLTEKMRTLLEVSEILLQRYEVREAELTQDILSLREENATLKGIIAKFKSET